jgi:hypothetical protein
MAAYPIHMEPGKEMTTALIRYRVHPSFIDENMQLVKNVFDELHARAPQGLSYTVAGLADGTFVHLIDTAPGMSTDALTTLEAFKRFQQGMRERCAERPHSGVAIVLGSYGRLEVR